MLVLTSELRGPLRLHAAPLPSTPLPGALRLELGAGCFFLAALLAGRLRTSGRAVPPSCACSLPIILSARLEWLAGRYLPATCLRSYHGRQS
jgi:hypothetical protein